MKRVVVVTGLSGAGRSVAAGLLEDLGWFVIDNLPADLVPKVGELASLSGGSYDKVALVMGGGNGEPVPSQIKALREHVREVTIVFLEASTDVVVRRYEATKRRHPLADGQSLVEAIDEDREGLVGARAEADLVVDTSDLNPHELRDRLRDHFEESGSAEPLRLTLVSFGYKHGLPLDVDLVLDCRFLPNPHWDDELRPHSGLEDDIQSYVLDRPVADQFLADLTAMLDHLLPAYAEEGKSYLTIAFGCTGGRHRSVAVAERMSRTLSERGWRPRVSHRDIDR